VVEIKGVSPETELADRTVIIGAMSSLTPAPGSEDIFGQIDRRLLDASGFEGKAGQILTAPVDTGIAVVVGLGDEITFESLRAAAGNAVRAVRTETALCLLAEVEIDGAVRAAVEGLALGSYQFRTYKTKSDGELKVKVVDLPGVDQAEIDKALIGVEATNLSHPDTPPPLSDAPVLSPSTWTRPSLVRPPRPPNTIIPGES
jgi:leucyl aminopeptidase